MRPRFKKWMLIVSGALAVSLLVFLLAPRRAPGLILYQGKTLQAWSLQVYANDQNAVAEANAALRTMGPTAVPGLVHQLRHRDSKLRRAAFNVSQKMPAGLRKLIQRHLEAPTGPFPRMAAARSLGIIGPQARDAVPALARALADKEGQVCFEATLALARIGKDSVFALIEALRDRDSVVRQSARSGLNLLGPDAEAAVPALIGELRQGSPEDRAGAASILPRIGAPVVPPLLEVLALERGPVRESAANVLIRCYTPPDPGSRARARFAHDSDPSARKQAIERLASVRPVDKTIQHVLLAALNDPNEEVHLAVLKGWCDIAEKPQGALLRFSAGLRDELPRVREWSARALGSMGQAASGALPNLTRLSAVETNAAVREAENEAMRKILKSNAPAPAVLPN